jgi:predicted protein tyrosine phosphatase
MEPGRMNILCICNQGENRSRTAAEILLHTGKYAVRHDGFFKDRYDDALRKRVVFNPENLSWAETIIVFEEAHEELLKKYGYRHWGKCRNLHIDDLYDYGNAGLKRLVREKLREFGFL